MSQGHWYGVEETEILQALSRLGDEAGSAYKVNFEADLQSLIKRIEEWEGKYKTDLKDTREIITKIARKLDGKFLELSLTATDIQKRVEQREEEKLNLEKQKLRLDKIQLILSIVLAFVTGLLLPYLAKMIGI